MVGSAPLIVEALAHLSSHSCIIDGEAVACRDDGIASFDLIRHWHHADGAFLYAFDLIELNRSTEGNARQPARAGGTGVAVERAHRARWPHRVRTRLSHGA
jgi:hypothetical protein